MRKGNFYRFITIGCFAFLLASCATKAETEAVVTQTSDAAAVAETIAQADRLFSQREDLSKLRQAVQLLKNARNPDNRNFEVEWKFAKYNYFLGRQTNDETEAEKAFEEGERAAVIASRIEPEKPDGYFWYGANLGERAKRSPITVGLRSIKDIREAMHKVIEIQPEYQGASAFDALAQIELETQLTGGKAEKAIEYLEKGLELDKNNTYIYLRLAEAYLAVDRKAEAKKQLRHLLSLKPNPEYLPEYKETVEKAKKMLETKF